MSSIKTVAVTLASAVATSGTFTVTYPDGTDASWFKAGLRHKITALGAEFSSPVDFAITTFAATTCTVTWRHTATLPAGTVVRVGLDTAGPSSYRDDPPVFSETGSNPQVMKLVRIPLGAPNTADVDAVVIAGGLPASGAATLGGALVSGGIATFDVPRNITITGASQSMASTIFTVSGTDALGNSLVEAITGQTTATATKGVKAFKTVSSITLSGTSLSSTAMASNTVGFGDVLGLPVHLPNGALVLVELEDGAAPSAGTLVAGLSTATVSTATTADVFGTYDPNSACNGSKVFELIVALSDPTFTGNPQYNG